METPRHRRTLRTFAELTAHRTHLEGEAVHALRLCFVLCNDAALLQLR